MLTPPSVTWPQLAPQDRLENAGPTGALTPVFRQQHFPWLRQQEGARSLNVPAASGARDANDRSNASTAAITLRTGFELNSRPSIPGDVVYHAREPAS